MLLASLAAPLLAHHSVTAEFDLAKRFTVTGTLTKVDWINPHIAVMLDVKGDGGKVESWRFESNPPSWFRRVGVNRPDFAKGLGQIVTVEALRAKDGSLFGYLQKVTFADGTTLELVSPQ